MLTFTKTIRLTFRVLLRAFTNSKMDMVEKMDLAGETELVAPAIEKASI